MTQADLARRAGLSWIYIAKLEAGDRLAPSLPALERIARALGARLRVELVG
jgi:predicted transcriptional regulator